MENAFYIATCRFHVKEKDRLLITGYFLDNRPDGNRIEIRLDGKKLFYTTDGIRLHPLKFRKIRKRLITKQFFLWIHLPKDWREASRLEVLQSYRGKEELMKTFAVSELKNLEKWLANSIDKVNTEEKGFSVEGWYYRRKKCNRFGFWMRIKNELEMKEEKKSGVWMCCESIRNVKRKRLPGLRHFMRKVFRENWKYALKKKRKMRKRS